MLLSLAPWLACGLSTAQAGVTSEEVEHAIRSGVKFLKERQRADGSWPDAAANAPTGSTSLVTLALLTAGETTDSPAIQKALTFLRGHRPASSSTAPTRSGFKPWFTLRPSRKQTVRGSSPTSTGSSEPSTRTAREFWPGNWTYTDFRGSPGDNSNTQYALLGLNAASEAGIPVRPEVWALARAYFELYQNRDGGWGYTPRTKQSTASMTCAGISSLIFCGSRRFQSFESSPGRRRSIAAARERSIPI